MISPNSIIRVYTKITQTRTSSYSENHAIIIVAYSLNICYSLRIAWDVALDGALLESICNIKIYSLESLPPTAPKCAHT